MPVPLLTHHAERASDEREREWATAIRAGDVAVFAEVFRTLFPAVRVFLTGLTGPVGVAEELAQDVFVALWEDRERMVLRGSLRSYVFAAARNRALNYLKRERLTQRWADAVVARGEPSVDEARDPAIDAELAQAIADAVQQLSPQCRRMFVMNRAEDRSYGEIARVLGVSIKTVETQMARALRSLRARLAMFRR
jgi:RNA polymerase sigma-70 factor (ECF subfamily)